MIHYFKTQLHGASSKQQFAKLYFSNDDLADCSPNFPTTKVSLLMVACLMSLWLYDNNSRMYEDNGTLHVVILLS